MKNRHNKKRNTKFLYDVLIQELTKSIVKKDADRKDISLNLLKKYFHKNSCLKRELGLYEELLEAHGVTEKIAGRILQEAKRMYHNFDRGEVFDAQDELIQDINQDLSKATYNNFVPSYKSMATIYQIFNAKMKVTNRIMLEEQMIQDMTSKESEKKTLEPPSNLVFHTFVKNFNEKYGHSLFEEQKQLIALRVSQMDSDSLQIKIFLDKEINRLRSEIQSSLVLNESIKKNNALTEKIQAVETVLDGFKEKPLDDTLIEKVLKIQQLVREIKREQQNDS